MIVTKDTKLASPCMEKTFAGIKTQLKNLQEMYQIQIKIKRDASMKILLVIHMGIHVHPFMTPIRNLVEISIQMNSFHQTYAVLAEVAL